MGDNFLMSVSKQINYYKLLGEKAMIQVSEDFLFKKPSNESNSIAMIVSHLSGNMLSRWTDFLTSDGEKTWRIRDQEFNDWKGNRNEMMDVWNQGWNCFESVLNSLEPLDLLKIIYIRNEGHTVMEAINRQLSHYPYHIGQIIYLARYYVGEVWKSLSIPLNHSSHYNDQKFSTSLQIKHYTDDPNHKK